MGTKRRREEERMEAALERRRRDELSQDALGLIFSEVPIDERVTVIPRVCKSWAEAVTQPHCWQEIDLLEWTCHRQQPADQLQRMVQMLVARSSGSLRSLGVYGLQSDSIFTFIAENAGCLRTLIIPESKISDSIIEQIAGRLSSVTVLDVSYCMNMGACGLELIGKNCKLLERLHREMDPYHTGSEHPREDEAMAIASTVTNLKHLDISGHSMTTEGVRKILGACSKLEYLRPWHCLKVQRESLGLTTKKFPKLTVYGPHAATNKSMFGSIFEHEKVHWKVQNLSCCIGSASEKAKPHFGSPFKGVFGLAVTKLTFIVTDFYNLS